MSYDPTDAVAARALLEDALALTTTPTLTTAQVNRAFALASSLNANGEVIYVSADLSQAAAWGWNLKAGMTSNQYDLGGGERKLNRSQWHLYCRQMADDYRYGRRSVTAERRASGVGSIGIATRTIL